MKAKKIWSAISMLATVAMVATACGTTDAPTPTAVQPTQVVAQPTQAAAQPTDTTAAASSLATATSPTGAVASTGKTLNILLEGGGHQLQ
ncbi:MAG: hypothetical protein M3014_04290 [Chloroflexota bacterium]|nr:hypothetical protein [Chloroflexota bacterium]